MKRLDDSHVQHLKFAGRPDCQAQILPRPTAARGDRGDAEEGGRVSAAQDRSEQVRAVRTVRLLGHQETETSTQDHSEDEEWILVHAA